MDNVSESIKTAFHEHHVAQEDERTRGLAALELQLVVKRREHEALSAMPTFRAVAVDWRKPKKFRLDDMCIPDFDDQVRILQDMERELGVTYTSLCAERLGDLFQHSAEVVGAFEQMKRPLPEWFRDKYTWDDDEDDEDMGSAGDEDVVAPQNQADQR